MPKSFWKKKTPPPSPEPVKTPLPGTLLYSFVEAHKNVDMPRDSKKTDFLWETFSEKLDDFGALGFYIKAYVLLNKSTQGGVSLHAQNENLEQAYLYFKMAEKAIKNKESKEIISKELKGYHRAILSGVRDRDGFAESYIKTVLMLIGQNKEFDLDFIRNSPAMRAGEEMLIKVLGRQELERAQEVYVNAEKNYHNAQNEYQKMKEKESKGSENLEAKKVEVDQLQEKAGEAFLKFDKFLSTSPDILPINARGNPISSWPPAALEPIIMRLGKKALPELGFEQLAQSKLHVISSPQESKRRIIR